MEKQLKKNDHKGGWDVMTHEWLLNRAFDEWLELRDAILSRDVKAIHEEAADLANFAMMISDNCLDAMPEVEDEKSSL